MPNGLFSPLANTADFSALPFASIPRNNWILPAPFNAANTSPFGAVRSRRGPGTPLAYCSTLNPAGAFGHASAGRATIRAPLPADDVA